MKRKVVAILMVALMAITAGCGSSSSESTSEGSSASTSASSEESEESSASVSSDFECKEYSLALPVAESGLPAFEMLRNTCDLLEELTNGTIINNTIQMTPDETISFVESQIAAGVDGLIICPPSDSILPTITQLCEEAGVYWGITMRSIEDEDIAARVEASPYYVGNCYEDEYLAGYTCGSWMGEQGYEKIAIISQAKGDTTCDTREEGLAEACDEYGIEIVAESRGHSQASDTTAATESFLAAEPDLDAIFIVGQAITGGHEACIKAIQDAGREEVKVVTIDFPSEIVEDFESGILVYSYAQVSLGYDPFITIMKVVNAIQGTPITSDDNTFTSNSAAMFAIDNVESAKEYEAIFMDSAGAYYTSEEIHQFFKWENPDLDEDSLQEILDEYTADLTD